MKRLSLVLALLFSASLPAQAPEPVPLAHGIVHGEPHHHLRIENEYVRAYYVEVPPHEATQLHQHDHDYIYVSLGPADVVSAVRDKPEVHLQLKDGETHFTRGGFAHVARNLSDAPFRNITIELLKPQGAVRNRCAIIIDGPLQDCLPAGPSRDAIALREMNMPVPMFETDELVLEGLLIKSGGAGEAFLSPPDPARLLICLSNVRLRIRGSDQMWTNMHPGDDVWIPSGNSINVEKVSENVEKPENREARFLVLSFKDSVPGKKR
jgi:quercetin dioxygenase-like cupin family protein